MAMVSDDDFVAVDQGQLYFHQSGSTENSNDILWIHGLPLNSDSWAPQLAHFDPLCRNTVFDLRGYGRSSKLPKKYDSVTSLYMDDFLKVIEHCNLKQPTIVGFASAGHAALRFAALHPDMLNKLIIINGSPCFMTKPGWPAGFDQSALDNFLSMIDAAQTDEEIYELLIDRAMNEVAGEELTQLKQWYMQMAKQSGRETTKAFFNNIAYDDDRDLMSQITAPTLLISSRLGQEVPSSTAIFLRQQIKNSMLYELNDIDHFAYATKSKLINHVIEQFIFPKYEIFIPTNQE